jgi:hypothetical protein
MGSGQWRVVAQACLNLARKFVGGAAGMLAGDRVRKSPFEARETRHAVAGKRGERAAGAMSLGLAEHEPAMRSRI